MDFKSFARYQYTNDDRKITNKDNINQAKHRFRFKETFRAKFNDNFFGVLALRYDSENKSGKDNDTTDTSTDFGAKVQNTYIRGLVITAF